MGKNKEKSVQNRKTSLGRSSSLDIFASSRNVLDTRGQKEEKIRQEEEESHDVPQINGGRSLGSILYDEEEEVHDAELSQLDPGVLDEFIACYQIIKRRKGLTRGL